MRRAVLALTLIEAACSSWDTGEPNAGDNERACLDTVTALATAAARCGEEYQRVYDQQLQAIAGGDCKTVTSIRDESSLRNDCLPTLKTAACPDILAGTYPSTCAGQLERRY